MLSIKMYENLFSFLLLNNVYKILNFASWPETPIYHLAFTEKVCLPFFQDTALLPKDHKIFTLLIYLIQHLWAFMFSAFPSPFIYLSYWSTSCLWSSHG